MKALRPLEVWGGSECTINRVHDNFSDQSQLNGHDERLEDLELFAGLGLKSLRQAFLWERIAPGGLSDAKWDWAAARIERLANLNLAPIAGLLHHGSGPRGTSLIDPEFANKFSAYAYEFAKHFPTVDRYTPINEPLTTARFSGLYGFWYPHKQDNSSFICALLNQCRATILAMQAIRSLNPKAQLIQTEDMSKTSSTPLLDYQADFENQRRWLSFDILCGLVNSSHPLYSWLLKNGATEKELLWFEENPCPPDIMGLNHYVTSNRYLDEQLSRYPTHLHGGNKKDRYADVEAVRVAECVPTPLSNLLKETWKRYHIPVAVTEAQLNCTREEQMRWLLEIWNEAKRARAQNVDVRAVTVWGLLGHFNWHCLLTRCEGIYQPGVFDIRAETPRPTALAEVIHSLAEEGDYRHAVTEIPGWWQRPDRILYPAQPVHTPLAATHSRPLLITGARGTLGRAFARICESRAIPYKLCSREDLDIADQQSVSRAVENLKPWAIVNAAGYVRVDDAEKEPEICFRENIVGAVNLAEISERKKIPYLSFSSDLVFDGNTQSPYRESNPVSPLNIYGLSKARAESEILKTYPEALVVRTSAFFGPWDESNFLYQLLNHLKRGEEALVSSESIVSPTYIPDLVHASLDLLLDRAQGIWHLANAGEVSWDHFAQMGALRAHLDISKIICRKVSGGAPRPHYSALGTERGVTLPPLEEAIERYFEETR